MKKLVLVIILNACLLAQEETIEDFYKMSQENKRKYSLAELMGVELKDEKTSIIIASMVGMAPNDFLFLNNISQISLAQAKVLSQWKGQHLYLNGVEQLNEATAKTLSQWKGWSLHLNRIKHLDEASAKSLAKWKGGARYLNGVEQLDEATAKAIIEWKAGLLYLKGLKQINDDTIKILALYKGAIRTPEKIDKRIQQYRLLIAEEELKIQKELFKDFYKMSKENLQKYTLAELTGLHPILDKEALEYISSEIERAPTQVLFLNNISQLSLAQAKRFSHWKGELLCLNGLEKLDEETAKALISWEGLELYLKGLQEIDNATANVLSKFRWMVYTNERIHRQIEKSK